VRLDAQPPAGHIDAVDAIIADVAATKIVPPPPDTWQQVWAIGDLGCRAEPKIKVELVRRLAGRAFADRAATLAVPGFGEQFDQHRIVRRFTGGPDGESDGELETWRESVIRPHPACPDGE
jgi:hypothetical protein